ncbi:MAG: FAD-dependent oxidoreductase [Pirellula sp.]|jgi:glycine oxidase|nr:FAD-dependent oxidoreductase [Pirellula sp.]
MKRTYDLVVCGGGVIGLSIALESALFGWKVAVLEAAELGKGSSWAGAGILPAGAQHAPTDPLEQLRSLSHRLHGEWALRLRDLTGIDTEYRRCGGLYIATTPAERATMSANRMWWSEHGIACEPWSHNEATRRLPHLAQLIANHPNVDFWYVPDDCRVRNPRHLAALIAACRKLSVDLFEYTRVIGFEHSDHRIESVRIERGTPDTGRLETFHDDGPGASEIVAGERVCITAGAWSVKMLEELGVATGILPVRGQMVLYRCEEPPFSMILNEGHRYLVPRDDGHVLAGSCEEEVGFECETTPSMIAELRFWAETIWPDLAKAPVASQWAGLRPGSFDSFPYLGPLASFENAYIASGHFRHGLHWSTATAVLMRELMTGSPTSVDLAPFRVQRGHTSAPFTIFSNPSGPVR